MLRLWSLEAGILFWHLTSALMMTADDDYSYSTIMKMTLLIVALFFLHHENSSSISSVFILTYGIHILLFFIMAIFTTNYLVDLRFYGILLT